MYSVSRNEHYHMVELNGEPIASFEDPNKLEDYLLQRLNQQLAWINRHVERIQELEEELEEALQTRDS